MIASFIEGLYGAAQRKLEDVLSGMGNNAYVYNILSGYGVKDKEDFLFMSPQQKGKDIEEAWTYDGALYFTQYSILFRENSQFYPARGIDWNCEGSIVENSFFLPHQEKTWIVIEELEKRIHKYVIDDEKFYDFWEFYDAVRSNDLKKYLLTTVLPYVGAS